jgi:hypothetical protein
LKKKKNQICDCRKVIIISQANRTIPGNQQKEEEINNSDSEVLLANE